MNGRLAATTRRPDPALAEPVDLDRRDRRQVAGHERQHARRHDRDEPGEERDRELLKHRSARAPRRRAARARASSAAGATAGSGRAPVARPVPGADAERHGAEPRSRRAAAPTRAGRSRASRGVARMVGPNCATIASRICSSSAARDPARGCAPSSAARSASSTRRASSCTSGRRARPRARPASGASCTRAGAASTSAASAATSEPHARARARDAGVELCVAASSGPAMCGGTSGRAGRRRTSPGTRDAPVGRRVAERRRGRSGTSIAVALAGNARAGAFEVLHVDAEEHDALVLRHCSRGRASVCASCLHGAHVRLPEVDDDDLAAQRRQARACPAASSRGRSSFGAATSCPRRPCSRRRRPCWCTTSQTSRPSSASTPATATDCARHAHQTDDETVVPMSTWSKSHSASGTCMRMQPCEAL